jgi:flagellar protein FlaJ
MMRDMDEARELLYVIRSLEILMTSGIGLEAAIHSIGQGGYGIVSEDFSLIMTNVGKGRSMEDELRRTIAESKYAGYKKMLNTLLNNIISDTNIIDTLKTQGGREEEIRTEKVEKYIEDLAGMPESLLTFGMLGPIILSLVGLFPQLMGEAGAAVGMSMEQGMVDSVVAGGLFITLVGMVLVGLKAHFKDPGL